MHVVEAASGDEALRYLSTARAVDLVFTDVHMPGKTNGLELARLVKRDFPGVPVIVTSGLLRPEDMPSGIPFVAKPYDLQSVTDQIVEALDAR
jgi:CheY-like chemotaxis protein